jgi:hypothetical protein
MRKLIVGRKRVSIALGLILTLALAGGAFAYWTQTGSGSGSATTSTAASVTVHQTGAPITSLYPGGPAQTLSGNFDNPNVGPVYVTSVTAVVHAFSSQADTGKPACTQADFAIGGSAPVGADIAAGNGVGSWTGLTIGMLDTAFNQDNCKGVTIGIDYTANP